MADIELDVGLTATLDELRRLADRAQRAAEEGLGGEGGTTAAMNVDATAAVLTSAVHR